MRLAAALAAFSTLLTLAACGGQSAAPLSSSELAKLVLQPTDLPGFVEFDEGKQLRSDATSSLRADPTRFGRQNGWKARFRAEGTKAAGPLVVESRADVFSSGDGAKRDLAAYQKELETTATSLHGKLKQIGSLGDAAVALELVQGSHASGVRTYAVAWRDGRISASVKANGLAGLALADVLTLARKQDERVARAA